MSETKQISPKKAVKKASTNRLVKMKRKSIPWRVVAKENIKKYTETGLALRGARLRAEMTQQELANAIEAQPHHISEMEHGKRSIGKKIAHRLAKTLKMSYKMFL
jgi:DNA-binding XRE family transcriptional regulator